MTALEMQCAARRRCGLLMRQCDVYRLLTALPRFPANPIVPSAVRARGLLAVCAGSSGFSRDGAGPGGRDWPSAADCSIAAEAVTRRGRGARGGRVVRG